MKLIARLRASDAGAEDRFGHSVAISGNSAIVSASEEDGPNNSLLSSGAAYIFDITNASGDMKPIARLRASDAGSYDYFGESVAISGTNAIVSAYQEDGTNNSLLNSGAAYIFDITNASGDMKLIARLRPSDAGKNDYFGYSVAISGNYAIVGANYNNDGSESDSGSAYIFDITSASGDMNPIAKIQASDRQQNDQFGISVAISGTNAIVGAYNEDGPSNNISYAGAAYIFNAEVEYQTKGYAIGLSDEKVEIRLATDASQSTFEDLSYVVADASINTSQINHIVITNTANTQKIYVNGSEVKSGALIQYISSESGSTNIGFYNTTSPSMYYQGSIYDVQYYNDVLTSAEITEIYDNVSAVVDSNLTLRTSNHTLANTGVNYVQTVFDASFSKVENTFLKTLASKTVNAVETSSLAYYVQTYAYSNSSHPDLYKSGMVRDICVNEYLVLSGKNPHYVQVGNTYTDASLVQVNPLAPEPDISFVPYFNSGTATDICVNYVETYSIVGTANQPDLSGSVARDVSVAEWIASAGQNPHYIQMGNSYTDASYTTSTIGTSTYTENVSFSPELNVNVADTYTQTYTVSNSEYVDVARTLTRDVSVHDFLDILGESPHFIQLNNDSYTDVGIKEPTGIVNGSTSSTFVEKNVQEYADGFNYDGSGIEVPYDASHNEDSFSVSMWVDASSTASYQPLVNSLTSVVSSSWTTNPTQRLRASDAGSTDYFGHSVAISGNYAIVGATYEDGPSNNTSASGAAYIFDITNGSGEMKPIARLRASDAEASDQFGGSVGIDGSYAIVGVYAEDGPSNSATNSGAAYIFDITNASGDMKPIARLRPSDAEASDLFGVSVGIDGNSAIVGAYYEDGPNNSLTLAGAAYIFDITNASGDMKPIARLRPSDREAGDWFGYSVAIDGSYAIVGAYTEDGTGNSATESGAAYIFDITSASGDMNPMARLRASDAEGGDHFGWSVAISGSYAIVGANREDGPSNNASNAGAAYIFDITNASGDMKPIARLRASDAGEDDQFGRSVAISGTNAIVGAYKEDGAGNSLSNAGAAYIFDITNASGEMKPIEKIQASDAGASDYFGGSVAISGTNAIVGAIFEDGPSNNTSDSGAAYIFNFQTTYETKGYAIGLSDEKVEIRLATDASQATFEDLSYVVADASINTSQINHIVITNTANTQKIYVNGSEVKIRSTYSVYCSRVRFNKYRFFEHNKCKHIL